MLTKQDMKEIADWMACADTINNAPPRAPTEAERQAIAEAFDVPLSALPLAQGT